MADDNEVKHTQGEWKANGNGVHYGTGCVAIAYDPDGYERDVAHANARLIAAAPDLLAVLVALVSHPHVRDVLAPRDSLGSLLTQAEAAIAKARTGGPR